MTSNIVKRDVKLPEVDKFTAPMLLALTDALGVERNILASDQQIYDTWQNLPNLISEIPPEKRDEGIMRMCVAVASGLFDAAVNYAWNAAIIELREKIRRFGINIIPQIIDKDFDETKLMDMQDADLLNLCLKLNLISETGYFMLDQCRDIRNNFSAAHPAVGALDEYEVLSFLNRCVRHALSEEQNTTAVDIKELMQALNVSEFSVEQYQIWNERIEKTFEAQREAIFGMLHGIFCDPAKEEHTRVNAIKISKHFSTLFSPAIKSALINQHQRYLAQGDQARLKASRKFFESIQQLDLLSEVERHSIVSSACRNLIDVHKAMNNFYNEAPFAERLASLATGHQIPETVQFEFVETVVTCSVGNEYGTANTADIYYQKIIRGLSPKEIDVLLSLPSSKTLVGQRIKYASRCRDKFAQIVRLLKSESIPTKSKSVYEKWVKL